MSGVEGSCLKVAESLGLNLGRVAASALGQIAPGVKKPEICLAARSGADAHLVNLLFI